MTKTKIKKPFLKNLAYHLIIKEKIKTTRRRAKELKPLVEHFISKGKKQNLAAFRFLLKKLPKPAAEKVYYELAPRYQDRRGGCLRLVKHSKRRLADGAELVTIEFI